MNANPNEPPPGAPEAPTNGPSDADWLQSLNGLFQAFYGRDATPEEIRAYTGRPIADIKQTLSPGRTTPNPAPTGTPAPVSAPAPAGGPAASTTPAPTGNRNEGAPVANPTSGAPTPNLPNVPNVPAYTPPPAFSYPDFQGVSAQDVLNDPSYKFELQQGLGAIGHKAAALGTLNTGGTIGDYVNYGQGLASTHWGDLFNQKMQTYQAGRQNALSNYNTNYQTQFVDPYQINYTTQYHDPFIANYTRATDLYNSQQHNYDQNLYYQTHNQDQNQYYNWQNTLFGHQVNQDDFNNRLRLLGLIS